MLGVDVIGDRGCALSSTLLLSELLVLGVGVNLLGISGVLGGDTVGNLGGLLTGSLYTGTTERGKGKKTINTQWLDFVRNKSR